jgi:guanylate kinase
MITEKISLKRRGMCFVLSSPSGAGKTTISRKMLDIDSHLTMSISYTTREPRPGEVHGVDYFFISKDAFREMINADKFVEHAEVFGNFYGTPRQFVEENLSAEKDVIFDIDWQGTRQLSDALPNDVVSVFILPPSMAELENRLKNRAQDSEETVAKRMKKASREISHWNEYDYVLINNDLNETMENVNRVLLAERLRLSRQPQLENFVQDLLFGED